MKFFGIFYFKSYSIGLCFSLGTHASLVWHSYHAHESEPSTGRASIYKRLIPLHMLQQILPGSAHYNAQGSGLHQDLPTPNPRPQSAPTSAVHYDTYNMAQVAAAAAAAAAVAATTSDSANLGTHPTPSVRHAHEPEEDEEPGGHDSPNWSKFKSGVVLVLCTIAYSFIAGI